MPSYVPAMKEAGGGGSRQMFPPITEEFFNNLRSV